jgi:hypothetical protein
MVARQFIAWDVSKKAARPVGTVRAALADVFTAKVEEDPVDLIIPFPTGRNLFSWLPGTSYLATFIQSLRDKSSQQTGHEFGARSLSS